MGIIWSFIVLPYIQCFFCELWENYGRGYGFAMGFYLPYQIHIYGKCKKLAIEFPYNMEIGIQYIHIAAVFFLQTMGILYELLWLDLLPIEKTFVGSCVT